RSRERKHDYDRGAWPASQNGHPALKRSLEYDPSGRAPRACIAEKPVPRLFRDHGSGWRLIGFPDRDERLWKGRVASLSIAVDVDLAAGICQADPDVQVYFVQRLR